MAVIDTAPLENSLGFLALGAYTLTLMPTNLRIIFPQTKQAKLPKWLLKYRRLIGILAFCLALFHAFLLVKKRDVDFLDINTYWIYIQGISTFIIFTLLAITSNDWSIKRLKKNWKRLHTLTYLAMFLLTWHVWDKMLEHWSYLTPIGLVGIVVTTLLFLMRRWIEFRNKQQKAKPKVFSSQIPEKITS
ncbi:ferric reductase-like transmembrane domain-containing protein [Nostoc sp. TCL26-01]|uniref:ferric reductase-like transmembrane domain-containing protein n=1 Tax=Nostoc sp. TCL26-01 TaxID=2576904 RepID=UPI0015BEB74F|nr:ferric reductase-like transmembrane domain-containing protein [Nostoc sp. TCL26-01]QLE56375.1 iron reductase [Nostoc sp. TCL26-01]